MLLGEDSRVRDYWNKIGRDATEHGLKGVIMMASMHLDLLSANMYTFRASGN